MNKKNLVFLLLLLIILLSLPAFAELPPLIPREALFAGPQKASPKISPDGSRIAYLAPSGGIINVWVQTIGKEDARAVTRDKKKGIRSFSWSEDGNRIIFSQDSEGGGGGENWHFYSLDLTDGIFRDLTAFLGFRSELIAADPNFPESLLVSLNLRGEKLFDVYRLNLDTGALVKDTENPGNVTWWLVDPEFQVRGANIATLDGGMQLQIRDNPDGFWRNILIWPPEDGVSLGLGFTPDGKAIYLKDTRNSNTLRLTQLDTGSGKLEVVAEDPGYDLDFRTVLINPRTHRVEAVSFFKERRIWTALDPAIKKDLENLSKLNLGDFVILNRDKADKNWLVSFTSDLKPASYYLYNRESGKVQMLYAGIPELLPYQLAPMKPIAIKARDGLNLQGYLTLPVGLPPQKLPLVLKVHGGPWARDYWGLDGEAQWLANRGYACLQVNFRGSTGYGRPFLNAGNKEWGAKMQDDLTDAVQWAIKEGFADPKRIAIYGASYGGYAALAGAAFTPDLYTCAVDISGPSNLITLLQNMPINWPPERKEQYQRIGNPHSEEEMLKSRSPLFSVGRIKIPLLIAQGAADPRVKPSESDQIVKLLMQKGNPLIYMLFPDEAHSLSRLKNRLIFYKQAEEFLARYLGGRVEP